MSTENLKENNLIRTIIARSTKTKHTIVFALILFCSSYFQYCSNLHSEERTELNVNLKAGTSEVAFNAYWYADDAELTSYTLRQARYGELHDGHAVLIFVTEPFSKKDHVKSETNGDDDISVLKLNTSKKFNTGLYPYSILTSVYSPFSQSDNALKISSSTQDWCGHTFTQVNCRKDLEFVTQSYFQSEGDRNFSLMKNELEDGIWTKIRLAPDNLPVGELKMIPSFSYLRLLHTEIKAYDAIASLSSESSNKLTYKIEFPELKRTLEVVFESEFPYKIESWKETYPDGWGTNAKLLTTTATLNKRIKTAYWRKNRKSDTDMRKQLGL